MEHWRSMQPIDQGLFLNWLGKELDIRWKVGQERYECDKYGFQGDPFMHLKEELLDALLYWYWEYRKREDLLKKSKVIDKMIKDSYNISCTCGNSKCQCSCISGGMDRDGNVVANVCLNSLCVCHGKHCIVR